MYGKFVLSFFMVLSFLCMVSVGVTFCIQVVIARTICKIPGSVISTPYSVSGIRRLQLILVKISLVLGIKILVNTSFVEYLEPCKSTGWRISVKPSNLEVEMQDFHVRLFSILFYANILYIMNHIHN